MKKITLLTFATFTSITAVNAANVYTLDLSATGNAYVGDTAGTYLGDTGAGGDTAAGYDTIFGATNGVAVNTTTQTLDLTSVSSATTNRYRGGGVWINTNGWATGTVTVTFDITNYSANGSTNQFQAYTQTGALTPGNGITIDLHGGNAGLVTNTQGSATLSTIGSAESITGNTSHSVTFNTTGSEEGIALLFTTADSLTSADYSVSNVAVDLTSVPEPSSTMLAGLGGLAFMLRRRR